MRYRYVGKAEERGNGNELARLTQGNGNRGRAVNVFVTWLRIKCVLVVLPLTQSYRVIGVEIAGNEKSYVYARISALLCNSQLHSSSLVHGKIPNKPVREFTS